MSARPASLHMPQLMRATERTRSQVHSGPAMLRDTIAKKGWPPLIYTRVDGYQFTADGDVRHMVAQLNSVKSTLDLIA